MIPVKASHVPGEIAVDRAYSAPVNVPDWSKILKDDYKSCRRTNGGFEFGDEEDDDRGEDGVRVPPHELLAKQLAGTGISSLSVHEGVENAQRERSAQRSKRNF